MPLLKLQDATAFYRLSGHEDRPVLVLSHSLGQDHGMWDPQIADLSAHFRVLQEIHTYVTAATDIATPWEVALDEQFVQKVLPRIRGADNALDEGLAAFLNAIGDGFPLSRAKTETMREDFAAHGFASFV